MAATRLWLPNRAMDKGSRVARLSLESLMRLCVRVRFLKYSDFGISTECQWGKERGKKEKKKEHETSCNNEELAAEELQEAKNAKV